jgi:hypothetical protein
MAVLILYGRRTRRAGLRLMPGGMPGTPIPRQDLPIRAKATPAKGTGFRSGFMQRTPPGRPTLVRVRIRSHAWCLS